MSERLCKCEHNFDAHRPSIQHRDRTACHICACVEWRPEPAPPAPPAAPAEALAALDKHLPEGYAIGDDATAELAVKLARAESELTDVRRELEDSHARVEALEKALRDYGYHNTDCPAHDNSKACTCGWESARKLL